MVISIQIIYLPGASICTSHATGGGSASTIFTLVVEVDRSSNDKSLGAAAVIDLFDLFNQTNSQSVLSFR
jgi:hypothetical protein